MLLEMLKRVQHDNLFYNSAQRREGAKMYSREVLNSDVSNDQKKRSKYKIYVINF